MSFVRGYANDIFISYSHIDNDPLLPGKPGWVDFFEALLRKRLKVRIGGEIKIFRDPELRHYGKFSDQINEKLLSSAVFLCILSPRYLESDWCLRELDEFGKRGKDRIIKVVKTAIDEQSYGRATKSLLATLAEIRSVQFYSQDESSRLFVDLMPEIIPDHVPRAVQKIDDIVQNVVELLKKLRRDSSRRWRARYRHDLKGTMTFVTKSLPERKAKTKQNVKKGKAIIYSTREHPLG